MKPYPRLIQLTRHAAILLMSVLSFSACTTLQAPVRQEAITFSMDARMATEFAETQSERNVSGDMRWEERPSATDITLSTAFGNTMALIQLTPTQSTFKGADGSVVTEASPEELFYRLFGMDLPLANLHDWIGSAHTPLTKIRNEKGWHVVVTDTFDNPNLARRLEISRTEPEFVRLTVAILERSDINTTSAPTQDVDLGQLLPQTPKPEPKPTAPKKSLKSKSN